MPAFELDRVNALADRKTNFTPAEIRRHEWTPPLIFIGIDPSGGGDKSDTAVVSLFISPHNDVVVSGLFVAVGVGCGLCLDGSYLRTR